MDYTARKILGVFAALIVFFCLEGCHQKPEKSIYEGMSFEEFQVKNQEESYFQYFEYLFMKNNEGDHIVARVSDDWNVIAKVNVYKEESVDNSDQSFSAIKKGMSIEEVISMVGIPQGSYTSGMPTLSFESTTGKVYWIYLNLERTEMGTVYSVESVLPIETE